MITVAHDIDCSDEVVIGDHSGLAGYRSAILTHSLNLVHDRFTTGPVVLGHHAAVMSGCTLMSGTTDPVTLRRLGPQRCRDTPLTQELTFYGGDPAQAVRALPETLGFFHRGEDPEADRSVLGVEA